MHSLGKAVRALRTCAMRTARAINPKLVYPELAQMTRGTGRPSRSDGLAPPVDQPLAWLQADIAAGQQAASKANGTNSAETVTRLANGVTVASIDLPSPVCCVGMFVNVGARHETEATRGISHLLERLAFKSTTARSQKQIVQHIEEMGSNVLASGSADVLLFSADGMRDDLEGVFGLLADNITRHAYAEDEVAEQLHYMLIDVEDSLKNFSTVASDVAAEVAFGGKGLGSPVLCNEAQLKRLNRESVLAFAREYYIGSRLTVSGVGVEHDALVRLAQASLGSLPRGVALPPERSVYTGGMSKRHVPELGMQPHLGDFAHVVVGFEGAAWESPDTPALAVLQSLLGGGASFSAGGPGKGMYTQLYRHVLGQMDWVNSVQTLNVSALDTGFFGIHGTVAKTDIGALISVLAGELANAAQGEFSAEEVSRARNMLRSTIAYNLEKRFTLTEDIGRQYQLVGRRVQPSELFARINAVTIDDLRRVARKLVRQPVPTVLVAASTEDALRHSGLPSLAAVQSYFRAVSDSLAKRK